MKTAISGHRKAVSRDPDAHLRPRIHLIWLDGYGSRWLAVCPVCEWQSNFDCDTYPAAEVILFSHQISAMHQSQPVAIARIVGPA